MINKLIQKYENELQDAINAMQSTKEQVFALNRKGEELAAHATFLNGKIEALKEVEKENNVEV